MFAVFSLINIYILLYILLSVLNTIEANESVAWTESDLSLSGTILTMCKTAIFK